MSRHFLDVLETETKERKKGRNFSLIPYILTTVSLPQFLAAPSHLPCATFLNVLKIRFLYHKSSLLNVYFEKEWNFLSLLIKKKEMKKFFGPQIGVMSTYTRKTHSQASQDRTDKEVLT